MSRSVVCPTCNGHGKADFYQLSDYFDPCPTCNGTGSTGGFGVPNVKRSQHLSWGARFLIGMCIGLCIGAVYVWFRSM